MESIPLAEASVRLTEIVERACSAPEGVVITENGVPVAAVVAIEEFVDLQRARDELDIALCERAMRSRGEAVTHDEFMAMLAREDATSA